MVAIQCLIAKKRLKKKNLIHGLNFLKNDSFSKIFLRNFAQHLSNISVKLIEKCLNSTSGGDTKHPAFNRNVRRLIESVFLCFSKVSYLMLT